MHGLNLANLLESSLEFMYLVLREFYPVSTVGDECSTVTYALRGACTRGEGQLQVICHIPLCS